MGHVPVVLHEQQVARGAPVASDDGYKLRRLVRDLDAESLGDGSDETGKCRGALCRRVPGEKPACVRNLLARTMRTPRYFDSDASSDASLPPIANTARHSALVPGSETDSPCRRALSAMECSMIAAATGMSTRRVGIPKAPPPLCSRFRWDLPGASSRVRTAASGAVSSAPFVALNVRSRASSGNRTISFSTAAPRALVSLAARPGLSSRRCAVSSSRRSSWVSVMP